jgi:hypothetical protein
MNELQASLEQFCKSQYLKLSKITDTCYRFPESSFDNITGTFYLDFFNNCPFLSIKLSSSEVIPASKVSKFSLSPEYYENSKIIRYSLNSSLSCPLDLFNNINETLKNLSFDLNLSKNHLNFNSNPKKPSIFNKQKNEFIKITQFDYKNILKVEADLWCVDIGIFLSYFFERSEVEVKCFFVGQSKMIPVCKKTVFEIGTGLDVMFQHFQIIFNGNFRISKNYYDACEFKDSAVLDEVWEDFSVCVIWGEKIQIDGQSCNVNVNLRENPKRALYEMVEIVQFRRMSNKIPD